MSQSILFSSAFNKKGRKYISALHPRPDLKSLVQSLAFLPLEPNEIQIYVAVLCKLFDIDQHIMCSSEWTVLFGENQMQVVPKVGDALKWACFRFAANTLDHSVACSLRIKDICTDAPFNNLLQLCGQLELVPVEIK